MSYEETVLASSPRAYWPLEPTTIGLEGSCRESAHCEPLAEKTYEQLSGGNYTYPVSTLVIPDDFTEYLAEHRTARKRAARAARLGYRFEEIAREDYAADIYAINTSLPERQGRPMSDGYLHRQAFAPLPDYPCDRHRISVYGVLASAGTLVAYAVIYRVGDLVMVSQILGHGDELENDVMYLLLTRAIEAQSDAGSGVAFYNRHDSGTDGLRYYKERCGFTANRVRWELG